MLSEDQNKITDDIENLDDSENIEESENTENSEDSENIEESEFSEDSEDSENIEESEDSETSEESEIPYHPENSSYETLLLTTPDSVDSYNYTSYFENIQTILIFQSTVIIAIGLLIAWVSGFHHD